MKNRTARKPKSNAALMVIDARVDTADVLTQGLATDVRVLRIDQTSDAIAAVSANFERFGPVKSLALFAHGTPDRNELGAEPLTSGNLRNRATDFAPWRANILPGGHIAVYSRRQGESDNDLTETLVRLTGCGVASASGLLGASDYGGAWELDLWSGPRSLPKGLDTEDLELLWTSAMAARPSSASRLRRPVPFHRQQTSLVRA